MQRREQRCLQALALALLMGAGCAASVQEIRVAKTARYDTEFTRIYIEMLETIRSRYPNLSENPRLGIVKTAWHPINIGGGGQAQTSDGTAFSETNVTRTRYFIRFRVRIVGGRPFRLYVQGEASKWVSGAVPEPLRGGDEPPWLQGRIDALWVAIDKRLASYRIAPGTAPAPEPGADAASQPAWGDEEGTGEAKSPRNIPGGEVAPGATFGTDGEALPGAADPPQGAEIQEPGVGSDAEPEADPAAEPDTAAPPEDPPGDPAVEADSPS